MSRIFNAINQSKYQGIPLTAPIKLGTISGVSLPLFVSWIQYGALTGRNVNVLIDLDDTAAKALDQIRSIYIDNLGSLVPIYVYFPDTGYSVTAKPNSEGWYPAFTNSRKIWVIGEGFQPPVIPFTTIILCNIPLPPGVNTEIDTAVVSNLASANITRGSTIYNTDLGVPALGDQFNSAILNLNNNGQTVGVLNSPIGTGGFIYITSVFATVKNYTGGAAFASNTLFFESTGAAGIFFSDGVAVGPNEIDPQIILLQMTGQWKIDGLQTWRVRNLVTSGAPTGSCTFNFSFTTNPK